MDFLETKIYTTTQGIDSVTGVLLNLGITGFVIEDSQDFENFLTDTEIYWDYVDDELLKLRQGETNITVYLPKNAQGIELFNQIKVEIPKLAEFSSDFGRLHIQCTNVNEQDWENNWKQYFKPFYVGEKFVIKPSWEEFSDKTNRKVLEIDPSSSFGTGTHETTKLCIESLEKHIMPDDLVLDMGTGSGILSIASLMLGAKHVTALDIDENSVKIARENLEKNNLKNFTLHVGNVITDENLAVAISNQYDVVVANIVADVIILMKEILYNNTKKNGILITSGIINERHQEVLDNLLSIGFKLISKRENNDWVALELRK